MGIFDGTGSSSGGLFGSTAVPTSYAVATPTTNHSHGIGGFFNNLGNDVKGLTGIPAGLKFMGSAGIHDAKVALGVKHGPYQLDNIGRDLKNSYTDKGTVWGEAGREIGALLHGDMAGFRRHRDASNKAFYAHPMNPILDLSAAFTGGGSIAGKVAAKVAAETGSETAMRIAGLQAVKEITPATVRGISGRAGTFAAATRDIIDPVTKQVLHELPLNQNPILRARQIAKEAALAKLPASNYLSATRRGVRLGEAATRRIAKRDAANLDRLYHAAHSALSTDEKDALFYIAQGFNTVDRAKQLILSRTSRVQEKVAEHAAAVKGGAKARAAADTEDLLHDAKVIQKVLPLIAKPTPKLEEALKAQHAVDSVTQATFVRNMVREGRTVEEAWARIKQRARMPLEAVGIAPHDGEVPMIITHVENALKRGKRGQDVEHGMATKLLDEERETGRKNFLNARYERDASTVLATHRLMFAKEQTFQRIERALARAVPYDRVKHKQLIDEGKLHWIKKNDQLISDMKYVDDTLDRAERSLGKNITDAETERLRDAYHAMHDMIEADGSPGVVIPKAHYEELISQFRGAKGILEKITDGVGALTKPWRHIVLSLKGSFYVNNFIGNLFLGLVAYGPRYILDVAHESLPKALRGDISGKIASETSDMTRVAAARNVSPSRAARLDVISRVGEKVASKGALLTEDNFRRGAMRANLRTKVAEFRKATPGLSRHDAIEAIFNDKNAVDQLAEQTYGDLLDYSKLTPVERELLIPVLPFWNFTRAMTGRTIRLTLDEPWKMRVLMYFGDKGIEANTNALKGINLPEYLRGMVMLDPTGELPRVLSTAGSNPFTAPADLFAQLMSIKGGGNDEAPNILSSFNPFFKVPLEALVGKDMFTGQDIVSPKGDVPKGIAGRVVVQGEKNIPQLAMLQRYRYPSKYPAVQRGGRDTLLQYAGVPVGDLNTQNIAATNAINEYYKNLDAAAEAKHKAQIAERARF